MKTTIEITDHLFREAKATAARRGISLRQFLEDAVTEKLARQAFPTQSGRKQWPVPPPDVPRDELKRIHALIEEQSEKIEPLEDDQ